MIPLIYQNQAGSLHPEFLLSVRQNTVLKIPSRRSGGFYPVRNLFLKIRSKPLSPTAETE